MIFRYLSKTFKDDILPIIKGYAPLAAQALHGLLGKAALDAVTKSFGLTPTEDPEADAKELEKAVKAASAEDYVKMKKADTEMRKVMNGLQIKEHELFNENTANARDLYADVVGQKYPLVPPILAGAIVIVFLLVLIALVVLPYLPLKEVKDFNDIVLIMIGTLVACFKDVYNFFFGSSAGSKEKTKVMASKLQGV